MPIYDSINILWIVLSAFLVFMMQLGFALLETGTVRAKNTINVAMKNLIDTIFGVIFFWLVGFGLMFGDDLAGLVGTSRFLIDGSHTTENAFFFFQAMFAATAVTIVSGAVAERMKFNGYVLTAIVVISVIYPVFGHWAWSEGGWLQQIGFVDFAGSTVVHSVGAWIGLAGAIILGPRLGKFRHGRTIYFSPSNHNFIVFGVFVLTFAWFGFNAGSLLAFGPEVTKILLNTLISASFGGLGAYIITLFNHQRVSVEIFSFGIISGLVGITAGCAEFSAPTSAMVGFVSAFIMFFTDMFLRDHFKVDDPLSVVGVHGAAGAWGTIAVGMFAALPETMTRVEFILVQSLGVGTAFLFAFGSGLLLFGVLFGFKSLRVHKRHEVIGLNISEHNAKLPWVMTIESILRIMRSGNLNIKVYEERDTEIGIVARFFNHLLDQLKHKQVELRNSNHELHEQATQDRLTGILNRHGLQEKLEGLHPYKDSFSFIVIDIDKFKVINDSFGHSIGDVVLRETAQLLSGLIRSDDLFGRWGGEEFLAVIRNTDLLTIEEIAEKMRKALIHHHFSHVGRVTCSFGVSSPRNEAVDIKLLFEQADKALYEAKKLGRNRVCSW